MATETSTTLTIVDAARIGNVNQVTKLVEKDTKALAETDESGDTALHIAAHEGYIKLTRYLLQKGANPNQQNKAGSTPLHKAASKGNIAVTEILLEHNADANIKNNSGLLPEDLADKVKLRVLLQGKDAVTLELPVPKDRHGLIIGKVGKNLEELRNETKTNISVPPSDNPSTHITIVGRKEAVATAKDKILQLLKAAEEREHEKKAADEKRKKENEERKKLREEDKKKKEEERLKREENYTTANVSVPKDRHGVIIGVHGATIREINAMGVKITIPPRESAETQIKVYGEIDSVEKAIKRIMELTHAPPRKQNNQGGRRPLANGDEAVANNTTANADATAEDKPKDNRRGNRKGQQNAENGTPATAGATTTTATTTTDDSKPKREPKPRPPKKDNATTDTAKDSASEQTNDEKPKAAAAEKPKPAKQSSPAPTPATNPAPAAEKPKPAANNNNAKKKPNKE
jgi:rRNA processing protein Krr1/Pno1